MPKLFNRQNNHAMWIAPTLSLLACLLIFVFSLGKYYLHYFPYEDDFSLIRASTVQNSPVPISWITRGFTNYFANDPQCATRYFGFDRPVVNASFYLESLLYRSAQGPLLLFTNFSCWIISAWFIYAIARRLNASNWIASIGILLYAFSPCWYRILIHASFRNNGLSTCFVLAASYTLLKPGAVRSWARLMIAGLLLALASASHEQGFTSLPVFALGLAWLSQKVEAKWRIASVSMAIFVVVMPSILMSICFRLMNPMYGISYVTASFSGNLTQSRRLAAHHIHNPIVVLAVRLVAKGIGTLLSALDALTPLGTENMASFSPKVGWMLFCLVIAASLAVYKRFPAQLVPLGAFLLYAVGRSLGIPSAEPRFMELEVAWGVIALLCALSNGLLLANRIAVTSGIAAVAGLMAFNCFSYSASVLMRAPILNARNEVDHQAFYRIESAASEVPTAQVILINDQAGIESSRDLLKLAGVKSENPEILPSIMNGTSTDGIMAVNKCPVVTEMKNAADLLQVKLDYPEGCAASFFGRDMACMTSFYSSAGRMHSASWANYLQKPENQGLYPSPLIHDITIKPENPILIIAWHSRLETPVVLIVPRTQNLPSGWQILH